MTSPDITHMSLSGDNDQQRLLSGDCETLGLKMFEYTEHRMHDMDSDIDPENNFYNTTYNQCEYYTEEKLKRKDFMEGSISIIHFNCRSMKANFSKIKQCLRQLGNQFTAVAISETWLEDGQDILYNLEGYELFLNNRTQRRCGGVALYIDKRYKTKQVIKMSNIVDNIMECITVEIEIRNSKNALISCIYRTPGSCIETFREMMMGMYDNIANKKMVFVCGDINIDLLAETNTTTEFINSVYSMSLYPTITRPTRITTHSATLIDNIFTNIIDRKIISGIIINDATDHLPVFAVIKGGIGTNKETRNKKIISRLKTDESLMSLKRDLMNQDWKKVYVEDVDEAYNTFLSILNAIYDKNCPLVSKTVKNKFGGKPWITNGIQKACKKKNALYKEFLKKRTTEAENKYKLYKNKLIRIMRSSKRDYYSKVLEDNKSNIKNTWKVLNGIIKKGSGKVGYPTYFQTNSKTFNDMSLVADEFNKFFVGVGPDLAKKIRDTGNGNNATNKTIVNSMFLKETDEKEIIDIVNTCIAKTSIDNNGIDMALVKSIIEYVVKPLTYICNISLKTGIFPNRMKIAKVIPIYKAGDKHELTNYRPVSLLPQFSKILEKVFYKRLEEFVTKNNILCEQQYGFRANRTTTQALIEFVETVTTAIVNKDYAIGVFLDLSKAFDTVHHELLLRKLERYGIRGLALSWVSSYLKNRTQYVELNNQKSQKLQIKYGVPQGSVLGPLLFILYVNDICEVSKLMKTIIFADDTNLICCGENLDQLLDTVEHELKILKQWFDSNKLTLNLSKTKYIIFGNHIKNTNKNSL